MCKPLTDNHLRKPLKTRGFAAGMFFPENKGTLVKLREKPERGIYGFPV